MLTSSGSLTASVIAALLSLFTTAAPTADKVRTAAEIAAGVVPVNYSQNPYNAFRYMTSVQQADVMACTATQDVTTALQTLFTLCATQGQTATMPRGVYKISSALTWAGTGVESGLLLEPRGVGGGGTNDSQILVTGTGYTALTMYGVISQLSICIGGSGNACNGLQLGIAAAGNQNILLSKLDDIRVESLAGFGVQINEMFDTHIGNISVQLCGSVSATQAAFQMNNGGSQCNMTTIGRLQVEQAAYQAIYIDPSTLSCTFEMIHSERATNSGSVPTHRLGGDSCTYLTCYLTSLSTALVSLEGSNTYYGRLRVSGGNVQLNSSAVNVTYQGNKVDNMVCVNLTALGGNLTAYDFNSTAVSGTLTTNGQAMGVLRFTFSTIANIAQAFAGGLLLVDSNVTGTQTASGVAVIDATRTNFASFPVAPFVKLRGCQMTGAYTLGTNQLILAWDTIFNSILTTTVNNGSVMFAYDCHFYANLVGSAGGNLGCLSQSCTNLQSSTVGSDWFGNGPTAAPAVLQANTAGVWPGGGIPAGTYRKNPFPASSASYSGSICTTGGNSGVVFTNQTFP